MPQMTPLTPQQIIARANAMQKEEPGFSNYKQLFHDSLAMIAALALALQTLQEKETRDVQN